MGPLQPRTISVSITTYIATIVVLVLWLLAAMVAALYLFFYQRKRARSAQTAQTAQRIQRTTLHGNTTSRSPPNDLTALPSYPQRAQTPSYPPSGPSSLSATTRPTAFSPVHTSPNANPVPPAVPPKIETSSRTATASPTRNPVPAPPSIYDATQRALLANNPTQAADLARLHARALASDTTDMSTETVEPGKEVVNAGYMTMLAQRGVPLRDHALLGSDDSADAGGGTPATLSYAMHARGRGSGGWGVDPGRPGGRFMGRGGMTRAMTFGHENGDQELVRMGPQVRKMSSM